LYKTHNTFIASTLLMFMKKFVFLLYFLSFTLCSYAQQRTDSIASKSNDSISTITPPAVTDTFVFMTPKKIGLFSAIVPGLGQIKNKQYWKLPIVYALSGVSAYFLFDNIKNYNSFRKEYAMRLSGTPRSQWQYPEYSSSEDIKIIQDGYKQNLDLTVLLSVVGYTLQIIDAVVFAHLKNFDMSNEISLKVQPALYPQGGLGINLVMKF
jgi:hypothetical protein